MSGDSSHDDVVRREFARQSSTFAQADSFFGLGELGDWIGGELPLGAQDSVLDVCGGTADLALLAANVVGDAGLVTVYDINRAMMRSGQVKVAARSFSGRVCFVQGDAERMSFPDDSFDAVMVGFGIRNFVHLEEGLREMHRVLKKGGYFTILEFSRPEPAWFRALYHFYSFVIMPLAGQLLAGTRQAYTYLPESIRLFPLPDELSGILRDIGFTNVTCMRLTKGIAVVHRAEKAHVEDKF